MPPEPTTTDAKQFFAELFEGISQSVREDGSDAQLDAAILQLEVELRKCRHEKKIRKARKG